MKKNLLISTIAVSFLALTTSADAAKSSTKGMEKCYGVVKSGFGTTEATGSGEFIYLPKGTCAKLTNGSVTYVETKGTTSGASTTTEGTTGSEGTTTTSETSGETTTKTSGYNAQTNGGEVTMTKATGTTGTTTGSETTGEGKY